MTDNREDVICAHANTSGDASRCACALGPHATREEILTHETRNR